MVGQRQYWLESSLCRDAFGIVEVSVSLSRDLIKLHIDISEILE